MKEQSKLKYKQQKSSVQGRIKKNLKGERYFVGALINAVLTEIQKNSYSNGCETSGKWVLIVIFIMGGRATAPNCAPLNPPLRRLVHTELRLVRKIGSIAKHNNYLSFKQ